MDPLKQGSCAQNFFTQSYVQETEPFCGLAKDYCSWFGWVKLWLETGAASGRKQAAAAGNENK